MGNFPFILRGHFNISEDMDGGIWYGIDSNWENNTIFTFDGKQIDGKKAIEISDKIKGTAKTPVVAPDASKAIAKNSGDVNRLRIKTMPYAIFKIINKGRL